MADRPILTAELLSIGSELMVGETRDTNAGDLARASPRPGSHVARIVAVPDDLAPVRDAFATASAGPISSSRRAASARRRTT